MCLARLTEFRLRDWQPLKRLYAGEKVTKVELAKSRNTMMDVGEVFTFLKISGKYKVRFIKQL